MKHLVLSILTSILLFAVCCFAWDGERAKDPWKDPGLVPDKETAIRIAEAIVFPIYGEDMIKKEHPYIVTSENGFWRVQGTIPEGIAGGIARGRC